MLKLLDGKPQESPDTIAWLESLGKLEISNGWGRTAKVAHLDIGNYGDLRLSVWAEGDSIQRAAEKLAGRVRAMIAAGHVRF